MEKAILDVCKEVSWSRFRRMEVWLFIYSKVSSCGTYFVMLINVDVDIRF
jgi:hypothetical protein